MSRLGLVSEGQVLWRLVDKVRSHWTQDYDGEVRATGTYSVDVAFEQWLVEKVTPKGAWVRQGEHGDRIFGQRRWVSFSTRFLSATRDEALVTAVVRRQYHRDKEARRLRLVEQRLRAIQRFGEDYLKNVGGIDGTTRP